MTMIIRKFFVVMTLFVVLVSTSFADVLTARVDRSDIAFGETFQLIITLHGQVSGQPDLSPLKKYFDVFGTAKNTQYKNINGKVSAKTTWDIILSPRYPGKVTIPAIQLGMLKTRPITITIKKSSPQQSQAPTNGQGKDIYIEVKAMPMAPYQQSQVIYTVRVYFSKHIFRALLSPPKVSNAFVKQLGGDVGFKTIRAQQLYFVVERRYIIFPHDVGKVIIHPATLSGYVDTGLQSPHHQIFGVNARKPISIHGQTLKLHVHRKPINVPYSQWLPAKRIVIQDNWSVSPRKLRVNEPVTRTIIISGVGVTAAQLPTVARQTLPEFKSYPDKPVLQNNVSQQGVIGTRTERIALIPEKAGKFTLPAIKVHWWDTHTRKSQVVSLPAKTITILPAAAGSVKKSLPTPPPQSTTTLSKKLISPLPSPLKLTAPSKQKTADIIHNQWLWLAIILLILWLSTLFFWWRQRNPALATTNSGDDDVMPATNRQIKTLLKAVKQASLANDKQALHVALLAWAQAHWPQASIRNIGDISQQIENVDLIAALAELDAVLYNDTTKAWSGKAFWQVFNANVSRLNTAKTTKQNKNNLPPLHLD